MRDGNIEVNGIPENKNENLVKTIEQLSKTVGEPIVPEDILFTTRVAKLNKHARLLSNCVLSAIVMQYLRQ